METIYNDVAVRVIRQKYNLLLILPHAIRFVNNISEKKIKKILFYAFY